MKTVKFGSQVKIFEGCEEVKHTKNDNIKTWDGLSKYNLIFQNLILETDKNKINSILQSLNIFGVYAIKNKAENLLNECLYRNKIHKTFVPILSCGGGKNKSIPITQDTVNKINSLKCSLESYIDKIKQSATIR